MICRIFSHCFSWIDCGPSLFRLLTRREVERDYTSNESYDASLFSAPERGRGEGGERTSSESHQRDGSAAAGNGDPDEQRKSRFHHGQVRRKH